MELQQPQNLEAEQALLGAAFIDPIVVAEAADVQPADFFRAQHGDIWAAMRRLAGSESLDWIAVAADIHKHATVKDPNLEAYLQEITASLPSSYGWEAYARLVKECARRRAIIAGCRDAALAAYAGKSPSDTILGSLVAMGSLSDGRTGGRLLSEYVAMAESSSLGGGIQGVRCGIPSVDEALGGLAPGRLIVVGARPGQGKSSLIAQMATSAMDLGAGVLMFSLEMSGPELAARMICARARVNSNDYMRGRLDAKDREAASTAARTLGGQFFIDETPSLDIAELRLRAIRHRAKHGDLGLVVVDYLGLATAANAAGANRYLQVGAVSQGLKQLAKEMNVPVVAAHQINRGAEHEGKQMDQRPKLSQLRESGNIEQDADQVLLIWPFQKDPRDGSLVDWKADPRPVEVALAKNRHGPQALLYLDFHRRWTTFSECGSIPKPPAPMSDAEKHKMFNKPMTPSWTESKGADYE